jgi:hypothetical protein
LKHFLTINYHNKREKESYRMGKVLVEIYGNMDKIPVSTGCGCGPSVTMGEMYNQFMSELDESEIREQVEVKFIEMEDGKVVNDDIKDILNRGFQLPLTAVKGNVRFHSSIPFSNIYRVIKTALK